MSVSLLWKWQPAKAIAYSHGQREGVSQEGLHFISYSFEYQSAKPRGTRKRYNKGTSSKDRAGTLTLSFGF